MDAPFEQAPDLAVDDKSNNSFVKWFRALEAQDTEVSSAARTPCRLRPRQLATPLRRELRFAQLAWLSFSLACRVLRQLAWVARGVQGPPVVRFFDNKSCYSVHGESALLVAREYYKTTAVVKYIGGPPATGLMSAPLLLPSFLPPGRSCRWKSISPRGQAQPVVTSKIATCIHLLLQRSCASCPPAKSLPHPKHQIGTTTSTLDLPKAHAVLVGLACGYHIHISPAVSQQQHLCGSWGDLFDQQGFESCGCKPLAFPAIGSSATAGHPCTHQAQLGVRVHMCVQK